jgi:DNA-binding beta-propeller fold protein YncE
VGRSIISVYNNDGALIGSFGQAGSRIGEFRAPKEVWVDASNRVYVADTGNARVQVFQLSRVEATSH